MTAPTRARCGDWIPLVCTRLGLPTPATTEALTGGTANFNFLVRFEPKAHEPPVKITFCLSKDLNAARHFARLLSVLGGAPIGHLVGAPHEVYAESGCPVIVTRYVEGRPLYAVDAATAMAIGRLLADIHRPAPPGTPGHDMAPDRIAERLAAADGSIDAEFARFVAGAAHAGAFDEALPQALVHGDLFPDNIIRRPDGRLAAIDFEEAAGAPRVFDLAMTAVGVSQCGAFEPAIITALVAGYQTHHALLPVERLLLPRMIEHAAVAVAMWRYLGTPDERADDARPWREMQAIVEQTRQWGHRRLWNAITGA